MSSKMKGFLIYYENEVIVCRLPDDEAGKLFKSLFPYGREKIVPDFENNPALAMAFDILSMAIEKNQECYEKKCQKNRENVMKRWNTTDTDVYDCIQSNTTDTDVYERVHKYKDKNKSKDKTKINIKERGNKFIPPTIEEVDSYCKEKGYYVDSHRFVDFYESKGWMIGKNKMKDWKAAVRTWVKRDDNSARQQAYEPAQNDSYAEYEELYQKYRRTPSPDDPFQ